MKVYRIIDKDGKVVYSNRNVFSGLYTDKEDAERAMAGFKASWQSLRGPFYIQESTEIIWERVWNYDDGTANDHAV
jgi:Zn/Cd-binding protein ZinT